MNRATLDSLDREGTIGVCLAQAEAIEWLRAEAAALPGEIAELRVKLKRPPQTPNNSSIPPSLDRKTTEFVKRRRKKKPHPGAQRPLHPDPTQQRDIRASVCERCGADLSQSPHEACEAYDRIEVPPIAPEITRVRLQRGHAFRPPPRQE